MLLAVALLAVSAGAGEDDRSLRLVVEAPAPSSTVGVDDAMLFVSGRALLGAADEGERLRSFDVVIALDVSASTRAPSGADIDGDGEVGRTPFSGVLPFIGRILSLASTDPGDSILAAEVEATRTLIDQLDPDTTRVGVVAFSGDDYSPEPDAYTVVPLTHAYEDILAALDALLQRGPAGMTNLAYAADVATDELVDASDENARRVVLFMTDGQPTLPIPNERTENARRAIDAARRAGEAGVRFDTFGISKTATDDPTVVEAMAENTGGAYTPVHHPRDLVATFRGIRLAQIDEIAVRNLTRDTEAEFSHLGADGSYSALVELVEGVNVIEVRARARGGFEASERVEVRLVPHARDRLLDRRLLARRLRMLENRWMELGERARKRLVREMEAERKRSKRSLSILVDDDLLEPPESPTEDP